MELVVVPLKELSCELQELYGCIWFETNGCVTPERGWTEEPIMTMGGWTGGLRNVLAYGQDSLHFLEGHFNTRVTLEGGSVRVEFCGQQDELISREHMSWAEFVGVLRDPLPAFKAALEHKGLDIYINDVDRLIEVLDELERAID